VSLLDSWGEDVTLALYHLLSRNDTKDVNETTDIEYLLKLVFELRLVYEKDIKNRVARDIHGEDEEEEDHRILYLLFFEAIQEKAELFKHAQEYRLLCLMPTFALALVMMSRIRRHYVHASWFRLTPLTKMVGVHGMVSGTFDARMHACTTTPSLTRPTQFLAEFIIESVETLARIANMDRPPMEREELVKMRTEFMTASDPVKEKKLKAKMKPMKDAFRGGRRDLSSWGPDMLTEIDNCFVKAYLVK
jgi:hypothetical protein